MLTARPSGGGGGVCLECVVRRSKTWPARPAPFSQLTLYSARARVCAACLALDPVGNDRVVCRCSAREVHV